MLSPSINALTALKTLWKARSSLSSGPAGSRVLDSTQTTASLPTTLWLTLSASNRLPVLARMPGRAVIELRSLSTAVASYWRCRASTSRALPRAPRAP
ncbi:hypothetical protein D3C81_1603100 [compost metagenome]